MHELDVKYSEYLHFYFTGEQFPQVVKETLSSKEKLYLDTVARIKRERELLVQPIYTSRKAMEPPPPGSLSKIGIINLYENLRKKRLVSLVNIEILCVSDSKTKEAEFHNSIFRTSSLPSNG